MDLGALVGAVREGSIPLRAVAVTFDDGYADNLYEAKPLLERYGIAATVFITTGYVGYEREFWWDELDRLLLQPGMLSERLCLRMNGRTCQWELGEWINYREDVHLRYRRWHVLGTDDPTPRHRLYRVLSELLRPLPEGEREKILGELTAWAGAEPMGRLTHRALSTEEVVRLAEGGLVEVGAHSVTHSVLSKLPPAKQRAEIQGSKNQLEEILGRSVTSFAYPYGSPSDYTSDTIALVREAGFACACSNFAGVVRRGTDGFQLPRLLVRDWDGDEFARRLEGWLGG